MYTHTNKYLYTDIYTHKLRETLSSTYRLYAGLSPHTVKYFTLKYFSIKMSPTPSCAAWTWYQYDNNTTAFLPQAPLGNI